MGGIPEAPGLTDLDALYPTLEDPEPEPPTFPPLPGMPPLPENPPLPSEDVELPPVLPTNPVPPPPAKQDSKGRWIIRLILLLIIAGGAVGGAHYAGLLDLNALLDQIPI